VIDLERVIAGGLWIAGLSLALAAWSWAAWRRRMERTAWREALERVGTRRALGAGFVLFCAGMALSSRAWWERIVWIGLALASIVEGLRA